MTNPVDAFGTGLMRENLEALAENPYPGNGIVLGVSEGGDQAIQAYWIMGQTERMRNQILVKEDFEVKTEPFVEDPSLIIYSALSSTDHIDPVHVLSNGSQTRKAINWLEDYEYSGHDRFIDALRGEDFESDSPNYTPRISGMTYIPTNPNGKANGTYSYSIIRRNPITGKSEHTYSYGLLDETPTGTGICFHTYAGEGDPLPSFTGSPYPIEVYEDLETTADMLWANLNEENRVALAVKSIDRKTGEIAIKIINQLG